MNDDQQKSIPKTNESEKSNQLKALAKALMVNLTWSMAGLSKQGKLDRQKQQPPQSEK